jgi:gamma-glutamylputrescine oxidase
LSVSVWQESGPLAGVRADVAVVGAGIAGLSAAAEFERAGLSCVVLERGAPAAGASGRNAGYLIRGAADNYAAGVRDFGRETARALWRWTEQNHEDLKAIGLDRLGSYDARPSCLLTHSEAEAEELTASAALLREDGFGVGLIRPGDAGSDDTIWTRSQPLLGLVNPGDAVCNPVELVGLLCSRLEKAELYTGCDVTALERVSDDAVALKTSLGTMTAGRVFVATNAAAGRLLPSLRGLVEPNRGQMLALHCPGVRLGYAYYADHGSEYMRQLDDEHVIFGGARLHDEAGERTDSEEVTETIQGRLEAIARDWLGDEIRVVSRWAGVMGFSRDHLPMAGAVGGDSGVWFCGGFTGHGMSMGHRTAACAARAMLGEETLPGWLDIGRFGGTPGGGG